jgi:class 3 adenylate cyclase
MALRGTASGGAAVEALVDALKAQGEKTAERLIGAHLMAGERDPEKIASGVRSKLEPFIERFLRSHAGGVPGLLRQRPEVDAFLDSLRDRATVAVARNPLSTEQLLAEAETSGSRTILFTDIEGSTALTQRLGDTRMRELLCEYERITREQLRVHSGEEVKTTGDGFMASFASATRALKFAMELQRTFATGNEAAEEPLRVRIGVNAGEPIAEDKDLFGTAVNKAARIAAEAKGGEILVSDVVRQLVDGKSFEFTDRGETELKGFDVPQRIWMLRWKIH